MQEKSVAVVISTYNGEKYIEEQLESILNQSYDNISVFIRDDGSTDNTVSIINKIINKNETRKKIIFIKDGEGNLGFAESFIKTMMHAEGYDYYAMCDQDDFWLEDKIEVAVERLEKVSNGDMALYSCNYWICDGELNKKIIPCEQYNIERYSLGHVFMEGFVPGFTMVFNRELKEYAFKNRRGIYSHDKWISCVVVGLGKKFVFDSEPRALYRRHELTASSTNQRFMNRFLWKYKHIVKGSFFKQNCEMIRLYNNMFYKDVIKQEDKDFLDVFSKKNKFRKIIYKKRLRKKIKDEVLLRFLLLFQG